MKLYYDSLKTAEIEEKLAEEFAKGNESRPRVHLSDTGYCPFKCYNRIIGMEKIPVDKRGIGSMTLGTVGQEIIQKLYPEEWSEVEHEFIPSHADVLEDLILPLEVKYTGSRIFRATDIARHWQIQLMGYISIHDAPHGWFVIFNTLTRQWACFKMELSSEERESHRAYIREFDETVMLAVKTGDVEPLLELLNTLFPTVENKAYACKYCDYRPGRKRKNSGIETDGCSYYTPTRRKKS